MSAARADLEAFRCDPALSPREAVVAATERFLAAPVDPSRIAERDALVRDFLRGARAKLSAQVNNLVGSDMTRTQYALSPLSRPVPKPSELERATNAVMALGWSDGEIDLLRHYLAARTNVVVGKIDERGIEVDGAWLSRYDLREWGRPAYFINQAAWHLQFLKLEKEQAA